MQSQVMIRQNFTQHRELGCLEVGVEHQSRLSGFRQIKDTNERGGRLPTQEEWFRAAEGTAPGASGWGAVDHSADDRTPNGVFGLAGNVAEWVEGSFAMSGSDQVVRAVCGGSFRDPLVRSRCSSRRGYPDGGKAPYVGFRCAKD